ncbi:hypothetical protein ABW19_dt0209364 [Dactylella cylindrospora]|nr:hypothetical protein ABW19_dt0209364 [Dactylella cylindrospora]
MVGFLRRSRHVALTGFLIFVGATFYLTTHDVTSGRHVFPQSGIRLSSEELKSRTEAVKEAYLHSWNGYMKYAYPKDELLPLSKKGGNSMSGWGASMVDGIGTAVLMEFHDVVKQQLEGIANIDYTTNGHQISLFETTIRYLGGMLSAYDLLTGPYATSFGSKNGGENEELVKTLLDQSIKLADSLKFAFNTTTGIPVNFFKLNSGPVSSDETNIVAAIGTLVLEWTRLSDLTGMREYADLAQRAQEYLLIPDNPEIGEPFPGMLGTRLRVKDGRFMDSHGGWGALCDSFYEYLIKMWVYDPRRFRKYKKRWIEAADSTIKYLATTPSTRPDLIFVAEYSGTQSISFHGSHLACFIGGNYLLGGQTLQNIKYSLFGLRLVESCHTTYSSTASGIGPERFGWDENLVPHSQKSFFEKNGFYYGGQTEYQLRPEVIESYYHAYVVTQDDKYREWAWDAFLAINKTCRTDVGYATISDVSRKDGGRQQDMQESFWFAEVLKYLFLIFNEEGIQAENKIGFVAGKQKQRWVFNTEAHPFRTFV